MTYGTSDEVVHMCGLTYGKARKTFGGLIPMSSILYYVAPTTETIKIQWTAPAGKASWFYSNSPDRVVAVGGSGGTYGTGGTSTGGPGGSHKHHWQQQHAGRQDNCSRSADAGFGSTDCLGNQAARRRSIIQLSVKLYKSIAQKRRLLLRRQKR